MERLHADGRTREGRGPIRSPQDCRWKRARRASFQGDCAADVVVNGQPRALGLGAEIEQTCAALRPRAPRGACARRIGARGAENEKGLKKGKVSWKRYQAREALATEEVEAQHAIREKDGWPSEMRWRGACARRALESSRGGRPGRRGGGVFERPRSTRTGSGKHDGLQGGDRRDSRELAAARGAEARLARRADELQDDRAGSKKKLVANARARGETAAQLSVAQRQSCRSKTNGIERAARDVNTERTLWHFELPPHQ